MRTINPALLLETEIQRILELGTSVLKRHFFKKGSPTEHSSLLTATPMTCMRMYVMSHRAHPSKDKYLRHLSLGVGDTKGFYW